VPEAAGKETLLISFECTNHRVSVPVAFPILLFFLFGQPYERGFYCDDESLRYPYKDSTISSTVLYVVGIFMPILSVRC